MAVAMVHVLVEELPPVQRLALAYAPRAAREPTLALLALDARLARTLQRKSEPVLAQMRFAWWRDTLAKEPAQWPRGDELLALLRHWRDPGALTPLVDGWEMLLGERLDPAAIGEFAGGRGRAFGQLAAELGADPLAAKACGETWALGDLAANIANPAEREAVLGAARELDDCPRLPRALRPLTVLSGLARRALRRGGTALLDGPGAAVLAMRLGIAGR
jgi:phytoene synthase